ncbi:MBL fold metallo-hydrolase [Salipiger sp. P9]|uniref:MBL fold metallo-hydrolase n=1 Tax=Salipiger pentaromativorans TaxID=2943193 RepID=UPI002157B749|nr:MBL fold metallo-hydrolase [Salipiger pentaromativorans]MCR8549668.1 MBL fold metallo-hydrolase [Salipiger pentaromativorans]
MSAHASSAAATWRVGGTEIACLVDGGGRFGADVFPSADDETRAARLAAAGLEAIDTVYNAYLLRHDDGGIDLVDTGCGTAFGDAGGALAGQLAAFGIAPAQVNRLIMTHLHGDHAGGGTRDGAAVFPEAELVLHAAELPRWQGVDAPGGRLLAAMAGRIRTVADGEDLGRDLRSWHLPGHTPGHMGLRFGEDLVLVADILHSEAMQLPDPACASRYDDDAATATRTRLAALEEIVTRGLLWSGSHMLGPGKFARLTRDAGGYRRIAP